MITQNLVRITVMLALLASSNVGAQTYDPIVYITEMTDASRARTMEVWLWGPGERQSVASKIGGNAVFEPVAGRAGDRFAPGRHPLLVLFHGTNGNTRSMAWLGSALAARGYIVVSANHPGFTSLQVTQDSMMETWLQAEDGRFLIDVLLASDQFAKSIDDKRIGSIGFSLGGYSALAIAGVRLQIQALQAFCRSHHEEATCKLFPDALYGPLVEDEPQNRDVADPRVRAAVSLAPGYVPAMSSESMSAIDVPVLVMTGSKDEMLPVGRHARLLAGRFARGEYIEFGDASHFSFLGTCATGALEILREESAEFLCQDPPTTGRKSIHDRTVRYISSFLGTSFDRTTTAEPE